VPWLVHLPGYRTHLVELPGHGLSDPVAYQVGAVRDHTIGFMDDLFDALGLATAPVVGHSLGGMFALWYAAARPQGIASLIAIGEPAVALPGVRVRMPLSVLTVRVLGRAVLRTPTPRSVYRTLLAGGLSPAAAAIAPDDLVDVLRLAARRKGNARTVASLMHAIDGFRRPRTESVLTKGELHRIVAPTMFCLGTEDPFLPPAEASPSIAEIASSVLHEVAGGHVPWMEEPEECASVLIEHLTSTGLAPAASPTPSARPKDRRSNGEPQRHEPPSNQLANRLRDVSDKVSAGDDPVLP
jgi:pimeloyl-ACP methyl ester carboxylesterase